MSGNAWAQSRRCDDGSLVSFDRPPSIRQMAPSKPTTAAVSTHTVPVPLPSQQSRAHGCGNNQAIHVLWPEVLESAQLGVFKRADANTSKKSGWYGLVCCPIPGGEAVIADVHLTAGPSFPLSHSLRQWMHQNYVICSLGTFCYKPENVPTVAIGQIRGLKIRVINSSPWRRGFR